MRCTAARVKARLSSKLMQTLRNSRAGVCSGTQSQASITDGPLAPTNMQSATASFDRSSRTYAGSPGIGTASTVSSALRRFAEGGVDTSALQPSFPSGSARQQCVYGLKSEDNSPSAVTRQRTFPHSVRHSMQAERSPSEPLVCKACRIPALPRVMQFRVEEAVNLR